MNKDQMREIADAEFEKLWALLDRGIVAMDLLLLREFVRKLEQI